MNPNEVRKLQEKAPFPVFILVVLLFMPSFFLQPEEDMLKDKIANYDRLLSKGKTSLSRRKDFSREKERKQRLEEVLGDIQAQLPEARELPGVIDQINEVAKKNSVFVKSVNYSFNDKIGALQVPCYSIVMSFDSYYENMRRFVADLENLQIPLLLEEIVVSTGRNYRVTLKQLVK